MKLSFDSRSLLFDGRREFLFSGEIHYFRVPAADWRRRMRLLKEAGGNFVATYVPWIVHEPEEGRIVFGDRPERDLAGFLRTAAEEGLPVILRPGPYVYSELVRCGLPPWLFRDYPALRWKRPDGTDEGPFGSRISYLHPLFLEKARRWFRAVAEQARPFLAENGGPVAAVQLDNELAGIHFWFGALDANPETFGLGREDGRWPRWLARKYGSVAAANEAYGGAWASFAEIPPAAEFRPDAPAGEERRRRDFFRCYREQLLDYLATLQGWLREDGVPTPTCHNCGSRDLLPLFEGARDALGPDFLLGYDQYYSLGPAWPVENPTAAVAAQTRCNVDWVRALGWPAVGMEVAGGSPSDVPPILREDLLAYYMTHLAAGAKGLNLYVFTGGPNFEGTGQSSDLYDYNAPVRADGSLNATYGAVADFGRLVAERRDLLEAERVASVQVGFEWDALRLGGWAPSGDDGGLSGARAMEFARKGLLPALAATPYPAAWTELREGALDPRRPLLLPAPATMSEAAQRAVVAFLEAGGRLFLAPWAPSLDQDLRPCTVLRDFLRLPERHRIESPPSPIVVDGVRVFGCGTPHLVVDAPPPGADSPMTNARAGGVCGWWQKAGAGEVCVFGTEFSSFSRFEQAEMLERILARMGAEPVARSSNRNVLVETHRHPDGRATVFVSNLHASPQSTHLTLFRDSAPAFERDLELAAMQVSVIDVPAPPKAAAAPAAADESAAFQADVDGVTPAAYKAFRAAGTEMPEAARRAAFAAHPGLRRYDEAIERVFAEARATVVAAGAPPAVWLVYNMGLVVKTPGALFGIDIAHRQGARFAPMLDFALVTHNHDDHWDRPFYDAMNGAGKTVVSNFLDNYAAVRAGHPGGYVRVCRSFTLGDIKVRAALSDHNRYLRNFTTAFEISVGDWTLYHTGDSCNAAKLRPTRTPDLWVVHPRCGLDVAEGVRAFRPRRVAICHLCEMGHAPDRWRWTLADGREQAARAEAAGSPSVVPLWGERIQ